MKAFKIIITMAFLSFTGYNVTAQTPGIDSLYIVPGQPTINDEIQLVIMALHNMTQCYLDTAYVGVVQNEIHIETDYFTGWGGSFCLTKDTVSLGMLSEGHYELWAYFDHNNFQDLDSLSFFVGTPTNIAANKQPEIKLNLFPNPLASGTLNITYTLESFSEVSLEIRDITGKQVAQKFPGIQPPAEHKVEMNLKDLSKGVYFLRLRTGESLHLEKLVIQ